MTKIYYNSTHLITSITCAMYVGDSEDDWEDVDTVNNDDVEKMGKIQSDSEDLFLILNPQNHRS